MRIAAIERAEKAERIRLRGQRIVSDIIAIGRDLIEVRERNTGKFIVWIEREFEWSAGTAYKFINVANAFAGDINQTVTDLIDPGAIFLLASPKVPEPARVAAVEAAEAGEHITKETAERMIAAAEKQAIANAEGRSVDRLLS